MQEVKEKYKENKDKLDIKIKSNLLKSIEYPDVNIKRDKLQIREFIEKQVNKKSIAYEWPEIYEYWDYEKNIGLFPEDFTKVQD